MTTDNSDVVPASATTASESGEDDRSSEGIVAARLEADEEGDDPAHHHRADDDDDEDDDDDDVGSGESASEDGSTTPVAAATMETSSSSFRYPRDFLVRIPKADLHAHLDGSIRVQTLIELAREQGVTLPSYDERELEARVFPSAYSSLGEYLGGFGIILSVLRTREALERVAYEVATDSYDVGE